MKRSAIAFARGARIGEMRMSAPVKTTSNAVVNLAAVITTVSGLAELTGARLLAEIGDDRNRFTDAGGLKAYAGSAPVTRASGKTTRPTEANGSGPGPIIAQMPDCLICLICPSGMRCRGVGAAQRVQGERSVDDGVCGVGETFMVASGVPTQDLERRTHVEGALLGEHSLGLLDDHPAVQGLLQLPSDLFKMPQFALTQDRD
jgi:hypothetical protein